MVYFMCSHYFRHAATEAANELCKELEAGKCVLTRSHEEKNELKAKNKRQAEEIEGLKTQLAQALEENQKLKGGIYGKH
jgi:septal ring factor EnvC (AmiA/AmiB activator)